MYVDPYWQNYAPVEYYWHMAVLTFHAFLFITGLAANLIVIVYYVKYEKCKKIYDYLLVNLMFADLLIIVTNLPMAIVSCMNGNWFWGQVGCNIYAICGTMSGLVCISTMVFISIERLLVIKRPFKVLEKGKKTALCYVAGAWLYGVLWSIPPLFTSKQFVLEGFKTSCTFDYISLDIFNQAVLVSMNVFGFFIPILIMVISYTYILFNIRKQYDKMKERQFKMDDFLSKSDLSGTSKRTEQLERQKLSESPVGSQKSSFKHELIVKKCAPSNDELNMLRSPSTISQISCKRPKGSILATELKITKNTILIVLVFCIAWLPYAIISILAQFSHNREKFVTPHTTILPVLLAKLSTLLNPLIYVYRNKQFIARFRTRFSSKRSSSTNRSHSKSFANINM